MMKYTNFVCIIQVKGRIALGFILFNCVLFIRVIIYIAESEILFTLNL